MTRTFEQDFFICAGSVLACRLELEHWTEKGLLPDGGRYDQVSILIGELSYGAEMSLLARREKRRLLGSVAARLLRGRS